MNEVPLTNSYKQGYVSVGLSSLHATHRADMAQPGIHPLKFPATRSILWDHRHTGPASIIHINHYRNPVVIIEEKILRILQRYSQEYNSDTYRCLLIGSLTVDHDGFGVVIDVDRLETYTQRSDDVLTLSKLTPGDVNIPCVVRKNCAKPASSVEQYENSISLLCERCAAKSKVDVSHFIALQANCSYHSNNQTFIFHIDFDMVAAVLAFKASPINPVAIVPTALSKHLTGPLSMSEIQGEPKCGYLTMDHTRKLLLVLETDPKINSLPLVGIWISGLANIHDPFVWASCLRYLFNETLQERICVPPEPFLIVLYSPLHSKPEFYECLPSNGEASLVFSLSTCHEVVQLSKDYVGQTDSPVEIELIKVEHGGKREVFDAALDKTESKRLSAVQNTKLSDGKPSDNMDEIIPRNRPAPHLTTAPVVKPSVPEVSLLLDETGEEKSSPRGPDNEYNNHCPAGIGRMCPEPAAGLPQANTLDRGRTTPAGFRHHYNEYRTPDLPQQAPQQRQISTSQEYYMAASNPGCPNPVCGYPVHQMTQPVGPYPPTNQGQHHGSNFYPDANFVQHSRGSYPPYPRPNPRQHFMANFNPYPGQHSGANFPCYPGSGLGHQPRTGFPSYPGANPGQHLGANMLPFSATNSGQYQAVNTLQQGSNPGNNPTRQGISHGFNPKQQGMNYGINPPQQGISPRVNHTQPGISTGLNPTQPGISHGVNPTQPGISRGVNPAQPGISHGVNPTQSGISHGVNPTQPGISHGVNTTQPGISHGVNPTQPGISHGVGSIRNPGDNCGHHLVSSSIPDTFSSSRYQVGPYSDSSCEHSGKTSQSASYDRAPVMMSSATQVESSSNMDNSSQRRHNSKHKINGQATSKNNYTQVSGSYDSYPGRKSQNNCHTPNYDPNSQQINDSDLGSTQQNASQGKQQHGLSGEQPTPLASPGMPHVHSGSHNTMENSPGCNSGSTDSGLHSNDSADSGSHADHLLMSNLGPVPPVVYERLRQQDEQLKQLQEQLARLLAKQNSSMHDASVNTQSDSTCVASEEGGNDSLKEKCSVAVNTTLMWPNPDQTPASHSSVIQTHDQDAANPNNNNLLQQQSWPNSSNLSPQQAALSHSHKQRQFPSPIQQCNGPTMSNDSLSLGEFQLTRLQDATDESIVSDMVVDLPDYTSLSPEKLGGNTSGYPDSDSNRSPMFGESVSMYEQPYVNNGTNQEVCDLNDGNLLANNQKKFYETLIGNVQKLLAKHVDNEDGQMSASACDASSHNASANTASAQNSETQTMDQPSDRDEKSVDVAEITHQRLRELGVDLDNCNSNDTTNTFRSDQSFYMNSILLPKVNYMSMMFESSDSDLSHDANALAMKYLTDEQLSALALHQGSPGRPNRRHPCLDRIANDVKSDISLCGISSNYMSFATRKYLERYGLISGGEVVEEKREDAPVLRDHPALANVQQYLRKLNDRSLNGSLSSQSDDKGHTGDSSCCDDRLKHPHERAKYHSDGESISSEYTSSTHSHPSGPTAGEFNQTPKRTGTKHKRTPHNISPPKYQQQEFEMPSDSPVAGARVLDIERLKKLPKLL